jgi:hypothetical protein
VFFLQWFRIDDGLFLSLFLICHCLVSLPQSNPSLLKVTNFGKVVCTHFSFKSGVKFTIGNAFLVTFQRYMACLIWIKNSPNMTGQSFGFYDVIVSEHSSTRMALARNSRNLVCREQ